MNPLQHLTYNPTLVNSARRLHVAGILSWCEYRLRGRRVCLPMHEGDLVIPVPDARQFRSLQGFYREEWGELRFLKAVEQRLRHGGICYDVGSSIGQFLIPVAKLVGERGLVVGFEPNRTNYEQLLKAVAAYGLANARVFRLALGDHEGEAQIFGSDSGATIVPPAGNGEGRSHVEAVRVARGDDLRAAEGLPLPKAVKIDVEGAEFSVLSGLTDTLSSPICELLCLEIHPHLAPPAVTTEMVLSLVRSFGFNRAEGRPRRDVIHLIAEKTRQVSQ